MSSTLTCSPQLTPKQMMSIRGYCLLSTYKQPTLRTWAEIELGYGLPDIRLTRQCLEAPEACKVDIIDSLPKVRPKVEEWIRNVVLDKRQCNDARIVCLSHDSTLPQSVTDKEGLQQLLQIYLSGLTNMTYPHLISGSRHPFRAQK